MALVSNYSSRLKQIMNERGLRQVDILNKSIPYQKKLGITMTKSHLSQYVNGKSNPDQNRIYLLSKTLDVNEPWLMGFDVPVKRIPDEQRATVEHSSTIETLYNKLDSTRQKKVFDFAEQQLSEQEKIAQFPLTSKVETLAAHSSDPDKEYSLEKIEEINRHLDEIDKEHGIKKD